MCHTWTFRKITFEAANVVLKQSQHGLPERSLKNQSEMPLNHLPPIIMVQWKEIRLGAGTFLTEPWHYGRISPAPQLGRAACPPCEKRTFVRVPGRNM